MTTLSCTVFAINEDSEDYNAGYENGYAEGYNESEFEHEDDYADGYDDGYKDAELNFNSSEIDETVKEKIIQETKEDAALPIFIVGIVVFIIATILIFLGKMEMSSYAPFALLSGLLIAIAKSIAT